MSAYYSRVQAPEWMKYFLCLDLVRIGEIFEIAGRGGEFYECPYTRHTGYKFQAEDLAEAHHGMELVGFLGRGIGWQFLRSAKCETTPLNIPKRECLNQSGQFSGCYIDSVFTIVISTVYLPLARARCLLLLAARSVTLGYSLGISCFSRRFACFRCSFLHFSIF